MSFTTGHYLENFDQSHSAPASKTLSTFDWVSEKAAELKAQTRTALANKDNRQMAVEGVTLAAGLAASALLHINLSKSASLVEGIVAGRSEEATFKTMFGQSRTVLGETSSIAQHAHFDPLLLPAKNDHLLLPETPFKSSSADAFKPFSFPSPREPLFDGGFTLPEGVSFRNATKVPPNIILTEDLPRLHDPSYDQIVAKRFNLRLDLREPDSIGIMHPRFRNGSKQLAMMKSLDRNLSLYGNEESGIGILEYERLPSARPYFKNIDSIVQIKFSGDSSGVGSGTLISADGLIATAAHVVPPNRTIIVDTVKGQFEAEVVARRYNAKSDIAAIQLKDVPKNVSFAVPEMTSAELTEGMRAATIGHPQGLSGRFASVGSYVGTVNFNTGEFTGIHPTFMLDAVMPGNSGGPIFDAKGNFAAIVTKLFTPDEGTFLANRNRALIAGDRIEDLVKLLKKQRLV